MMKKLWNVAKVMAFVGTGVFALQSCDKDDDDIRITPPDAVVQGFNSKYPGMMPEWEFYLGGYEAEFYYTGSQAFSFAGVSEPVTMSLSNVKTDAYFSQNGVWNRTEFDVKPYYYNMQDVTVIPQAVRAVIQREAAGREVDDVKIWDMANGEDFYSVEIDWEPTDKHLNIRYDGTMF